jgi:hypothetical protein
MIHNRLGWIIAGGVAGLLLVAGIDALRSSQREAPPPTTSEPTATATTTGCGITILPDRARRQIAVSIEIRRGVATVVVEHVAGRPCFQAHTHFHFVITSRAKQRIGLWRPPGLFAANLELGEEQ